MNTRREFLHSCATSVVSSLFVSTIGSGMSSELSTRGVVLLPKDLSLTDWPERAKRTGLNTIGIHHQNSPQAVIDWIKTKTGQQFLESCSKLKLNVEYELHAMKELLPRTLFQKHPEWFRMNDKGERTPDANCCVHAKDGINVVCENAIRIAKVLRPTTGRYFYWGDDGQPWCQCSKCKELSASDQALLLENQIIAAVKTTDAQSQLAHLAYAKTMPPPKTIAPETGIFLEFAPIDRRYDLPFEQQRSASCSEGFAALEANLEVFPRATAQILEYWLDVSRFSKWKRPAQKLPWNKEVFVADLEMYRKKGIRHITSFAAWIDADYQKRFGDLSFLDEYGTGLQQRR
jgi:hypothetical protein